MALAALLLFGYRLWPAVLIAAFLVNLTTPDVFRLNGCACDRQKFFIALGNTLEALAGAWLVNRFGNGVRAFGGHKRSFGSSLWRPWEHRNQRYLRGDDFVPQRRGAMGSVLAIGLTWWLGDIVQRFDRGAITGVWIRKAPPQAWESLWWRPQLWRWQSF